MIRNSSQSYYSRCHSHLYRFYRFDERPRPYPLQRSGDTLANSSRRSRRPARAGPARNNNREFYAPGQCSIKLSVRSNNRTEQPGLNAGQSLATRDNGVVGRRPLASRRLREMPRDQTSMRDYVLRVCFLHLGSRRCGPRRPPTPQTKE